MKPTVPAPRRPTCPPWCCHPAGSRWPCTLHYRCLFETILPGDIDFCVELVQKGGGRPMFGLGLFTPDPTLSYQPGQFEAVAVPCDQHSGYARLSVGQIRVLRDALSETLRLLGTHVG